MFLVILSFNFSIAINIIKNKNKQSFNSLKRRIKKKNCYCLNFLTISLFGTHSKKSLLNPSSNSFASFTLSLLDKVTIGTYNFLFVISNFVLVLYLFCIVLLILCSRYSSLIRDEFYS